MVSVWYRKLFKRTTWDFLIPMQPYFPEGLCFCSHKLLWQTLSVWSCSDAAPPWHSSASHNPLTHNSLRKCSPDVKGVSRILLRLIFRHSACPTFLSSPSNKFIASSMNRLTTLLPTPSPYAFSSWNLRLTLSSSSMVLKASILDTITLFRMIATTRVVSEIALRWSFLRDSTSSMRIWSATYDNVILTYRVVYFLESFYWSLAHFWKFWYKYLKYFYVYINWFYFTTSVFLVKCV